MQQKSGNKIINQWSDIRISDGTNQDDRVVAALQPDYFNVDELSFEELLAIGAEFSSKVNYFNLNNKPDGSFAELFSTDEAVIMAMILSVDLRKIEAIFLRHYSDSAAVLADYVFQQSRRFNFWLIKLEAASHSSGQNLAMKIVALIEDKLATELHNLGAIVSKFNSSDIEIDFSPFGEVWRLEKNGIHFNFPLAKIGDASNAIVLQEQLKMVFYAFFNATSYLKGITKIYLQESLGSQFHDPSTGLFMAFLKLYQRAQKKINKFTQRHLDFYYNDVLRVLPRMASPESIYLHFEVAAGARSVLISKDSEFTAGKDQALKEIIFRTDNDFWLNDAKVVSLHTLCLQRDPLLSPEYELGYVSRIKSNVPVLPAIDTDERELHSWPIFGAEKPGTTSKTAVDAKIGFAITSPLLLLNEGERKIEICIVLDDRVKADAALMTNMLSLANSEQEFIKLFGRVFSRYLFNNDTWLDDDLKTKIIDKADLILSKISSDEVHNLLSQNRLDLFFRFLKETFNIRLTGQEGWIDVIDYIMAPLVDDESGMEMGFRLLFSLGQDIGAITKYDSTIHGADFESSQPLIKCCINPQSNFYPYSIFHDLLLKQVIINVDVIGLKTLQAHNNHGQLDPSKPFLPFGPLPSTNSFFVVGAYEIAIKNIVDLSVAIEWTELPDDYLGFEGYYNGYESYYSNNSFKIDFSVLADGDWRPRDKALRQQQSLFNTVLEGGRVDSCKELNILDLKYTKIFNATASAEEFKYGLGAREGFFKISLVAPATAFGHRDYPPLLTKVLSENSKRKKQMPIPNPPYTPTINRISLNYRAQAVIDLATSNVQQEDCATKIFHIHPFGVERLSRVADDKHSFLLPQYGYEGNLFIGISAKSLSGPLTLFFHISQDMEEEVTAETRSINWFYLSSNRWKSLEKSAVISDSSDGFLTSGIVTLDIPKEINRNNSVMSDDVFWLRASITNDPLSFCSLYSVQAQAARLTRYIDDNKSTQASVSFSKKWQTMVSIPSVSKLIQVGKSLPGRPSESRQQLITRTSERLHHKNRASTPWDYERLILQQFPNVFKVKCFSNMTSNGIYPSPGHLLIVVVPFLHKDERKRMPKAMMNSAQLSHIRRFVQSIASPFAKIEVRNPAYEQVQVRCSVKFKSESLGGYYLNQLSKAISDYISPWENVVGYTVQFGWSIHQKDVESYIRSLDYIEYVTNFSMLHITEGNNGEYHLHDSAMTELNKGEAPHEAVIRRRYPWSLAIPTKSQFIETIQDSRPITAQITGIDELEIGGTFIINGNGDYGQEE